MLDINQKLTDLCLYNQNRFSDCGSAEELKKRLDKILDRLSNSSGGMGLIDMQILHLLTNEIIESVDTGKIARDYFDYLEQNGD